MIKKHLSAKEQAKLLKYFDDHRTDPVVAMIELMFFTGIRGDECRKLKASNLDLENSVVHVTDASKNSRDRSIFVPEYVLKCLLRHCEREGLLHTDSFDRLLGNGSETNKAKRLMLLRRWERIRFEVFGYGFNLGLHSLRHTFSARVFKMSGNNLIAAQRGLGHKDIKTTMTYLSHIEMSDVNNKLQSFSRNTVKRLKRLA